jgi:DMSO/TMAO reductase YedYZ molybdopterin-dependent catalytic subunit
MEKPQLLTTRRSLITGLASLGGLMLGGCSNDLPPTYGNILRMGDLLTYQARRLLLPAHALVKEYERHQISSMPATGTTNPADSQQPAYKAELGPTYARLMKGGFADWGLSIEGRVDRPGVYTLADLKRFPSRTQITKHSCEEGWSSIAEWTGVPLRRVLEAAGIQSSARFVNFHPFDENPDGIDMVDALHPQTILAYGMNGRDLPVSHGAPVRVRVETQMGYKSVKYLRRIVVKNEFDDMGKTGLIQSGWSWDAGI